MFCYHAGGMEIKHIPPALYARSLYSWLTFSGFWVFPACLIEFHAVPYAVGHQNAWYWWVHVDSMHATRVWQGDEPRFPPTACVYRHCDLCCERLLLEIAFIGRLSAILFPGGRQDAITCWLPCVLGDQCGRFSAETATWNARNAATCKRISDIPDTTDSFPRT